MSISKRARAEFEEPEFEQAIGKTNSNKYNEETNKDGIINLGVAESCISYDMMIKKLESIPRSIDKKIFGYDDFSGNIEVKKVFMNFLSRKIFKNNQYNEQNIRFLNGGGTAIESMGKFLCDIGEKVLLCPPMYLALKNDFGMRFGVDTVLVPKKYKEGKYEFDFAAMEKQLKEDKKIKVIFICNPHNPTGDSYSVEELKSILDLALKYKVHLVSDEVYALSMIDNSKFTSLFTVIGNMEDGEKKKLAHDYTHFIYSLSKDFLMNGWRVGCIVSKNSDILNCFDVEAYQTAISSYTLFTIKQVFADEMFIDEFVEENQKRLSARQKKVKDFLKKNGIQYHEPKSTMFIWMKIPELDTFEKEMGFFNKALDGGVYLAAGKFFDSTIPGYFRICFTGQSEETVFLALSRVVKTRNSMK